MNTGIALALFFLGAFGLILAMIRLPSLEFYVGGMFIVLFIVGVFYSWGNAIRQGRKLEQMETVSKQSSTQTATVVQPQQSAQHEGTS